MPADPFQVYADTVDSVVTSACNPCHGPDSAFGYPLNLNPANEGEVRENYETTLRYVAPGDPESRLLRYGRGDFGHTVIWSEGDANYTAVLEWINILPQ